MRTAKNDDHHFCDLDLMLFDKVIAFDHFRQKLILIANMRLNEPETEYRR
ncbi:MAG: anthranilate synthase component I, partial [Oscillospiraceae bacterium]|nr:anthranilate synthase component I [Oscillospiraceae bacterium]